ncbi:protein-lysine N-methyltransferase EEF2KMT isoform X3 [Alligator mississippiensis]|uniref:protein-lysine N-methyltransferase EEF2KMT isoform X3 n=1 Tax=Alligator mississippiensis TaxID=8496 RepID=UPI002877526B|nr:protein-lysine N-methyltransferase EEF2KMT isoform X3 [Alligator mississippiensis]
MEPVRQDGRALALRFQARFLAARPLGSLPWADLEQKLKNSDSLFLLDILQKTILHPLSMKYPPSVKYRRCFLAELIKKPTGESITLSETVAIISQGTTGLVTWDAALYLAEWAIENSTVLNNRTVLELGSGIGLTGIVISKACNPKAYIFSDYHQCVLEQLKENIYLNGFVLESEDMNCTKMQSRDQTAKRVGFQGPKVAVAELDWESVTQEQLWELHPDVVIAADVVYDPEVTLSLIGVLQKLSASKANGKNPEIYIAFTIRNPDTYHLFQTELGKVGIGWHVIPTEKKNLFPYDTHSDITILQLLL